MKYILVIEDTLDFADALQRNLEDEGYRAEVATRGAEALVRIATAEPDLIILDLGLPDRDGLDVLRIARERGCACPVLVLTARGQEADTVEGFRAGADDYVTKPFRLRELLARIEALLRRAAGPAPAAGPAAELTDQELRDTYGLTDRQVTVARLLAEGYANKEIARLLVVSPLTARNHTEQVMIKLDVTSRARVGALLRRRA